MARVIVVCVWSLLLIACAGREPSRSGEGEGEGEAVEPGSVIVGGPCTRDADCAHDNQCLSGFCFGFSSRCVDDTHTARFRTDLSEPDTVDCGVWGGWCEAEGCTLPVGAECTRFSTCGDDDNAWPCIDGVCAAAPETWLGSVAHPGPLTLPTTVSPQTGCGVFSVETPSFVVARDVVLVQNGRRIVGPAAPVAIDAGAVVVCTGNTQRATTLELVTPAGRTSCIDDAHVRTATGESSACPEHARCAVALGSDASCRAVAGEACEPGADTCLGLCEQRSDGGARCVDEHFEFNSLDLCDERGRYRAVVYDRGNAFPYSVVCAQRCEHGLGCVTSAGSSCSPFTRCISTDGVTLDACPETGVCPE